MMNQNLNGFSGLKVLVTGGTGVIGSWLLRTLVNRNIDTYTLLYDDIISPTLEQDSTLDSTTNIKGSLTDTKLLQAIVRDNEINVVFHLGAQAIVEEAFNDPLTTFDTNIKGTYNILEACRLSKSSIKSVVIASSDKAYGTQTQLPYTESCSLNGIFPYEVSKSCTDLLARSYALTYQLPISIARCGNVYGGGDLNWNRIVPGTIAELLQNQSPVIRSDGSYRRDYIYVKDIVDGYISLALSNLQNQNQGEAFNFGNNAPMTVLDIVQSITTIMGKEDIQPRILATAHGEIHSQYLDSSKAFEKLQWTPQFSIEQGLHETVKWYKTFLS